MATQEVKVYIYDLSKGLAKSMSQMLIGKQLEGIWHTGIVVFGREYFFGSSGIESCPPGGTMMGQPDTMHSLGVTGVTEDIFMDYLGELSSTTFRPECYHLLDHNCNTFSDETAQFLCGQHIPAHITNLPKEVLETPFGAMIRPMIDSMTVNPSGGTQLFPHRPTAASQLPKNAANHTAAPSTHSKHSANTAPAAVTNGEHTTAVLYDTIQESLSKFDSYKAVIISRLNPKDAQLLQEIREYLEQTDCSWSLAPTHLQILASSILSDVLENNHRISLVGLLQCCLLKEDFVSVLTHDSQKSYIKLIDHMDSVNQLLQTAMLKSMCNLSGIPAGHTWCAESSDNMIVSMCCDCMLPSTDKSLEIKRVAAALAHNLTAKPLTDDLYVQIGSALIEVINREPHEEIVHHCLSSLDTCMKKSSELKSLAAIMELNVSKWQDSEKYRAICQSIQIQISMAT